MKAAAATKSNTLPCNPTFWTRKASRKRLARAWAVWKKRRRCSRLILGSIINSNKSSKTNQLMLKIQGKVVRAAPSHGTKSQFAVVTPPSRAKVITKSRTNKIKVATTRTIHSTTTGSTNSVLKALTARTKCRASAKQAKPVVSVYLRLMSRVKTSSEGQSSSTRSS